ncbi:hypothetical protein GA565_08455 [Rouxiella sp. S1S-2]|uniref:hypothetical protein n=1 Tax=Rouxiella sp. S1S-2 TaxID=2653856 RepID=UPI001264CFB3|nr:hypothetical protein [Rouxiella sp. S1S-2]KAB7896016.1 hypothetical protein GA565_08455 [Rouxiella sp. S1S-2]
MIDATPLTVEEILEQCQSLSQAIIEVTHPRTRESLIFILSEKIDDLTCLMSEEDILDKTRRQVLMVEDISV